VIENQSNRFTVNREIKELI